MSAFTDQLGRVIQVPGEPQRIISVVPSQTELLFSLGLDERVCGITKFCIHPPHWFAKKEKVGGTKNLQLEKIASLSPDLVLANKEENTREQIEWLSEQFPVWVSDIGNLSAALEMIVQTGKMCGVDMVSHTLCEEIQTKFHRLSEVPNTKSPAGVLYVVWHNPIMLAGSETFIHDMLERAGWKNLAEEPRYPTISIEQMASLNPRYVFLSSEPFPFTTKHVEYYQSLLPSSRVRLVDGEMFSWYGSRLLQAPDYFSSLTGFSA